MEPTKVRTLVAFSDNKHENSIPDYVLYINTESKMLIFKKDDDAFIVKTDVDHSNTIDYILF